MSSHPNPLFVPQVIEAASVWEMQPDESKRAYEAFLIYRDSETRRLADVAARLIPACSIPNVARWSSRHRWQHRAWAWDKEQDRILQAQLARDRASAAKRHLQISQTMQEVAVRGLLQLKARAASGGALNLSAGEIENMLTQSIKIERMILGVDKDRRQFTEIRLFIGHHAYEGEKGYGEEQVFEEIKMPIWNSGGEAVDDGGDDEQIEMLPPGEEN